MTEGPDGTAWATPAEIAQALDVKPNTVRSWIRRGTVETRRVGRNVWVSWPDALRVEGAAARRGWRPGATPKSMA